MMNATETPSANVRPRISHRLVESPASASAPQVTASPTKPDARSRRGPIRGKILATICVVMPIAMASGKVDRPELIAESPRPSWRYNDVNMSDPKKEAELKARIEQQRLQSRLESRGKLSRGCSRRS